MNRHAAAPLGTGAAVLDPWLPGSSDTVHPQLLEGEDFETHHPGPDPGVTVPMTSLVKAGLQQPLSCRA